jgi:hypothetical protein
MAISVAFTGAGTLATEEMPAWLDELVDVRGGPNSRRDSVVAAPWLHRVHQTVAEVPPAVVCNHQRHVSTMPEQE